MNKHSAVSDNIFAIRTHFGYTQESFAKLIGVSQVTVSKWESNGHSVSERNVKAICDKLPVSYDDIKSEENGFARKINKRSENKTEDGYVEVPLYGSISAGTPIEMIETSESFVIPNALNEKYPNAFLLKVKGESMNKKIPNGSYALIDPIKEVINGKVYAVCVNGFEATIKRVRQLNNGFELIPDSTDPTYKAAVYDYGEPGTEEITVLGRVVWYCIPFDYEI